MRSQIDSQPCTALGHAQSNQTAITLVMRLRGLTDTHTHTTPSGTAPAQSGCLFVINSLIMGQSTPSAALSMRIQTDSPHAPVPRLRRHIPSPLRNRACAVKNPAPKSRLRTQSNPHSQSGTAPAQSHPAPPPMPGTGSSRSPLTPPPGTLDGRTGSGSGPSSLPSLL